MKPARAVKHADRYALIAAGVAAALGVAGVAIYAAASGEAWVRDWMPEIAGSLLLAATGIVALDVVVKNEVEKAREQRLDPLRLAAAVDLEDLWRNVLQFLGACHLTIGVVRGDMVEALTGSAMDPPFPEQFVLQLKERARLTVIYPSTHKALMGDGTGAIKQIEQHARQIERKSNRIVQWYSETLDPATVPALADIQEYALGMLESMRSADDEWFDAREPHAAFIRAYSTVWPEHASPDLADLTE